MGKRGYGAVLLLAGGCFNSWEVSHSELTKLHGYYRTPRAQERGEASDPIELLDTKGRKVIFDQDTHLAFGRDREGKDYQGRFVAVFAFSGEFRGLQAGGDRLEVRLGALERERVTASRLNFGLTVVAVVVPTVLAAVLAGALIGTKAGLGGWHNFDWGTGW